MLAELLKSVGYNHEPFYLSTWGLVLGGELVWYVQVALYDKHLRFLCYRDLPYLLCRSECLIQ
jgi:hypothetical protein